MKRGCLIVAIATMLSCRIGTDTLAADIIAPGFGRIPTFRIECRNDTTRSIERLDAVDAVQLDGTVLMRHSVGEFLGGPPAPVPPRTSWVEKIALLPSDMRGVDIGIPILHVPLGEGHHSVAFRCGGLWSRSVSFYWEPTSSSTPR